MKTTLAATLLLVSLAASAQAAPEVFDPVRDVVAKHESVFDAPPKKIPSNCSTDAPLLGNGDLLVALGGAADQLQFRLAKADLWELRPNGRPQALGCLFIECPEQKGASYRVTQDLSRAITTGTFSKDGKTLRVESFVSATENTLVLKLEATGGEIAGTLRLVAGDAKETPAVAEGAALVVDRRFEKGMTRPTGAACALVPPSPDGAFKVAPGAPVILRLCATGLANTADFRIDAVKRATDSGNITSLRAAHEAWWAHFWKKSFVEIPDKALEQRYYLSHYCMGSASRLAHFPPGLFVWTVGPREPLWGGAYFNNYNFFAPFYGLYAANHLEQAEPCNDAVIDNLDLGHAWVKDEAKYEKMCRNSLPIKDGKGILLPVSMLPYGIAGAPTTWGQRSDASYACVPLASTWYATYDKEFARKAYPFVREVATFWEHYLVFENGRYVIKDDAVHENSGRDLNPIVSLAFVRMVMDLAEDMSTAIGVDADRHAKWKDIRAHLSDYPTGTLGDVPQDGRSAIPVTPENRSLPIFLLCEKGYTWCHNNTVGIQHIFPGNGIGLDSDPKLLQISKNQILVMGRWLDGNGCNSFYPAAVRVGHDPEDILAHLRHWVETASPNGMRADNPHGTEHFSVVPSTIQEMLLQSFDGNLRLFPNWPKTMDARFGTLRARGAFLVSAQLKGGVVSGVEIKSEKGRTCAIVNPWPGKKVVVTRNGKAVETVTGERFVLKTAKEETLELAPR